MNDKFLKGQDELIIATLKPYLGKQVCQEYIMIRFQFVRALLKLKTKKKFLVIGSKDKTDHITSVLESYSLVVYNDI